MIQKISIENFLTKKECDFFVNYYKKFYEGEVHDRTNILQLFDSLQKNKHHFRIKFLRYRINSFVSKKYNIKFLYDQIVHWPNNSYMNSHYDDYCDYTLVCYLNDDYLGGETVVENMTYYPKSGKMILFNSSKNKHSVNTIIGNRYTYISWWKSNGLS